MVAALGAAASGGVGVALLRVAQARERVPTRVLVPAATLIEAGILCISLLGLQGESAARVRVGLFNSQELELAVHSIA